MQNPFKTDLEMKNAVLSFEDLRASGAMNMWGAREVLGLTKPEFFYVMELYNTGEAQKIINGDNK